jgi:hypothetical protein
MKGCCALPARVSLRLLALGASPRGHEIFHHGVMLQLVFDGVRMVRTGCFEMFLEMVVRLVRLVLEIMLDGHDIILIGAVYFLVIVVGSDCNPSGVPHLPHLAALNAFTDGFGRCRLATARVHLSSPRTKTALNATVGSHKTLISCTNMSCKCIK